MSLLISLIIAIVVIAVVLKLLPLLGLGEPWTNIITVIAVGATVIWLLQHLL